MPQDGDYGAEEPPTPSQRLTNDDFRKLLMTPRTAPSGSSSHHAVGSVREAMANARYANTFVAVNNNMHLTHLTA